MNNCVDCEHYNKEISHCDFLGKFIHQNQSSCRWFAEKIINEGF